MTTTLHYPHDEQPCPATLLHSSPEFMLSVCFEVAPRLKIHVMGAVIGLIDAVLFLYVFRFSNFIFILLQKAVSVSSFTVMTIITFSLLIIIIYILI